MSIPLLVSADGIANVNGRAEVRIGPDVYGDEWTINYVSVTNNGASESRCDLYQNVVSDTAFLEATGRGNRDTSDTNFRLIQGETIVFVWQNADPGSISMAVARGTKRRRV